MYINIMVILRSQFCLPAFLSCHALFNQALLLSVPHSSIHSTSFQEFGMRTLLTNHTVL